MWFNGGSGSQKVFMFYSGDPYPISKIYRIFRPLTTISHIPSALGCVACLAPEFLNQLRAINTVLVKYNVISIAAYDPLTHPTPRGPRCQLQITQRRLVVHLSEGEEKLHPGYSFMLVGSIGRWGLVREAFIRRTLY